jgi:hypothetical protein
MMISLKSEKILYQFLEGYAEFFEHMVLTEREKLDSLLSNDLGRINHSISVQQATKKELENLERKRMELQKNAGFGQMSFEEIIAGSPKEDGQVLEKLSSRIKGSIDEIKFLNGKSMGVVEDKIRSLNNVPLIKKRAEAQSHSYSKSQEGVDAKPDSLLKIKI